LRRNVHPRNLDAGETMMLNRILIYGTIAGLIVGAAMSGTVIAWANDPPAYGMAIGYLTMLVALSLVFVAIKRHRDEDLGGVIRFWPAFGLGIGVSIVAGLIYVVFWEIMLMTAASGFVDTYAAGLIEQKRQAGASAAELARLTAEMEAFKVQYANPLIRLPMTFAEIAPVGLLVSLVSAGLLRNPRFMPARRGPATA
jgi:hypothetical protein